MRRITGRVNKFPCDSQRWTITLGGTRPAIWRDADSCLHELVCSGGCIGGAARCSEMHNVSPRRACRWVNRERKIQRQISWREYRGGTITAINRESSFEPRLNVAARARMNRSYSELFPIVRVVPTYVRITILCALFPFALFRETSSDILRR